MQYQNFSTEHEELQETTGEILNDVKNGKRVKWRERRLDVIRLKEVYQRIGNDRKVVRLAKCSTVLKFVVLPDGGKKLVRANFCKCRLCPMCMWRRSRKMFGQLSKIMNAIEEQKKYRYIFVTFTQKNVKGHELKNELNKIMLAIHDKLQKDKRFKAISKGWFRSLEITYNWERGNFHPHLHMIIAVEPEYLEKKVMYIDRDEWIRLWQECMELDYLPSVKVRAVTDKDLAKIPELREERRKRNEEIQRRFENGEMNFKSIVSEMGKYTLKSGNIIRDDNKPVTDYVVGTLDEVLHKRQLAGFSGIFWDMHRKLKLDDMTNGNLVDTHNDDDKERSDLLLMTETYKWFDSIKDFVMIGK